MSARRLLPPLLILSLLLQAADFWTTKPYTEWTAKEAAKLLGNSPWAKSVEVEGEPVGLSNGGRGGGRRGGMNGSSGGMGNGGSVGVGGGVGGNTGGPGSGPGGGGLDDLGRTPTGDPGAMGPGGGDPRRASTHLLWLSSRTVREAIAVQRFGREAGTSAEAKKLVDQPPTRYMLQLSNLPFMASNMAGETGKEMLMESTMLAPKDKDAIRPIDIVIQTSDHRVSLLFLFPKTEPIEESDKEVEFITKLGRTEFKQKFRLKDMVRDNKLDL